MRVLVAEDYAPLARFLAAGLRREAMAVDVAASGDAAEELCDVHDYDVVLLDRDLPGLHGDELCRRLAARPRRPRVLMLTAADAVADRVAGLALGADDYLPKPFAFAELVARIRTLARRSGPGAYEVLRHRGIALDPGRREARLDGAPLVLNPKEFAVLELLMAEPGTPVPPHEIVRHVWGERPADIGGPERLHPTMSRLRAKLGDAAPITLHRGTGYRLG
ncbi:response regulator transcription factor [Streptomyces sp. IBSNAI002]|uniref:response regulator transcription factor n=1 Tax=Streptomyces sp. IBSNAI002 TaxID=3457500 RepID=UPI003FD47AE7